MQVTDLPTLNAILNIIATIFLTAGYIYIRKAQRQNHQKMMIAALVTSVLFLSSYLIYHYHVGSVPYPHYDWTRPLYFTILIPHIILAALMGPFIIAAVYFAVRQKFEQHVKLVKWVWPVWMFVSVSGVLVYLMLYQF